jgi:exodeoxyribonuclease-3
MPLRLVTWNVNSLRQRLDHLARVNEALAPDVLCLQEIKVQDPDFPRAELEAMGFPHIVHHGQKSYNGVAILSRKPFTENRREVFCDLDDRRHIAVRMADGLEIHNFYVPAGGDKPDPEANPKFAHKLRFLREMAKWTKAKRLSERPAVILGDLNVAPLEWDVWNHKRLLRSVGHTPVESEEMAAFLASADLIDVARLFTPAPEPLYTWWGYRFAQSLEKNYGWRLDHMLATQPLAGRLKGCDVFRESRGWTRPSDHVPLVLDLS